MLLAGLQRQPIGGLPGAVDRDADQPARDRALVGVAHRHVGRMRTAIAHRHAVALHRADRDVGAQRAGRGQQHQRQRVGGHRHQGAGGPQPRDQGAVVAHAAERVGILQQGAEQPFGLERRLGVGHHQADADRLGARAQHRDGLRVAGGIDQERARLGLGQAQAERHRLRRRGRLVQQRGVGDVEAGEVADQGLEVEQRLQPPLRDLGLVRRVGGVPGRVLQDVALDHARQDRAVIALPDQRGQHAVAAGDLAQPGQHLGLRHAGAEAIEPVPGLGVEADRGGNGLGGQRLEVGGIHRGQHGGDIGRVGADMAPGERIGRRPGAGPQVVRCI